MTAATRNLRSRGLPVPVLLLTILAMVCVFTIAGNSDDVSAPLGSNATSGLTSFTTAASELSRIAPREFRQVFFWKADASSGEPTIGNPQSSLFHSPKQLLSLGNSQTPLPAVSFGYLFCAGLGVFLVGQWFGFSQSTSLTGGAVVLLGPYFTAQTGAEGIETVFYLAVLLTVLFAADTLHTRHQDSLTIPKRRLGKWTLLAALAVGLVALDLLPTSLRGVASDRTAQLQAMGSTLWASLSTTGYEQLVAPFAAETFVRPSGLNRMPQWETLCCIGVSFVLFAPLLIALCGRLRHAIAKMRGRNGVGPSSRNVLPDFTNCVGVSDYSSMTKVAS